MADARPILCLPPPNEGKFLNDLLALMDAHGFFWDQDEGVRLIRQRRTDGRFVTMQPKTLAKACDAVARFRAGDTEKPLPISLARILMGSHFITRLPREWRQIRQFRAECGGSFKAYVAWCDDQGLVPVVDSPGRFRTAIGNIAKADGE